MFVAVCAVTAVNSITPLAHIVNSDLSFSTFCTKIPFCLFVVFVESDKKGSGRKETANSKYNLLYKQSTTTAKNQKSKQVFYYNNYISFTDFQMLSFYD